MRERQSATQLLETIVTIIETWFRAEERDYVEAMQNQEGWDSECPPLDDFPPVE